MNVDDEVFCIQCKKRIADFEVFADVRASHVDGAEPKTIGAHMNLCTLCLRDPSDPIVVIRNVQTRSSPVERNEQGAGED